MDSLMVIDACAYCLFLAGASRVFRDGGKPPGLWAMHSALLVDFVLGLVALADRAQPAADVAVLLRAGVWCVYLAGLYLRGRRWMRAFFYCVQAVEIGWFCTFVVAFYRLAALPW